MEQDRGEEPGRVVRGEAGTLPAESLAARLDRIERRLDALERHVRTSEDAPAKSAVPGAVSLAPVSEPFGGPEVSTPWAPQSGVSGALAPAGRSLLVLAGAFALRSLTESGALPPWLGVALGIVYGALWLFFADRATGSGATVSATLHGLTSAIIVFPLLLEATTRFRLLTPLASALALTAAVSAGSVVARRRDLVPWLWAVTIGGSFTALALAVATRELVLFAFVLVAIAISAFWAGSRRGRDGPGWLAVAVLDGLVALMASVALIAPPERAAELFRPSVLLGVLLALVTLSFGAFMIRTYRTRRPVRWQEVVQGTIALVVGFGGALLVSHRGMAGGALPAAATGIVLAGAAYLASFTFIDRIEGRRASFIAYTTAALALTLLSAVSIWRGGPLAIVLSVAALVTAVLGSVWKRETLSLHAAVCLIAAATAAGLGRLAGAAILLPQGPPPPMQAPALLAMLGVAALFCWLPVASHGRTWGSVSRWAKLVVLCALCLGTFEVVLAAAVQVARGAGESISGAGLAVLRTALLSVAAILLALLGRSGRLREAGWLVAPVLVAGALKILFEDLRQGQPSALVLSFALFGGALILAPRLAHRKAAKDPGPRGG